MLNEGRIVSHYRLGRTSKLSELQRHHPEDEIEMKLASHKVHLRGELASAFVLSEGRLVLQVQQCIF